MTASLDPKFAKVVALMRSTQHEGERDAACARAQAMATAAGMSLDEALALADAPAAPSFVNIFDGFDDFMEREEPGWKARQAAEKSEKERQRLKRRAAIVKRYGSEEAALAPCRQEHLLRDAIGELRKPCEPPYERWTHDVDGYWNVCSDPPAYVLQLIKHAYPMPATFAAAMAEHDYWEARQQEIEDVLGPKNYGDSGLDLIPGMRFDLVRALVEHQLETTTLQELYARFKFYREMEVQRNEIEGALFRDLEAIVLREHLSNPSTVPVPKMAKATCSSTPADPSTLDGQIRAALNADPSRSDRAIAKAVACSPTTVGKVRGKMGLSEVERSVQRGGQMYEMRSRASGAAA